MKSARTFHGLRRAILAGVLACSSAALWGSTKGPDAGGYSVTDEVVSSFVDISGASGGTSLLSGTDDGTAVLGLPFAFSFYGVPYSIACVSTNGALYFVATAAQCSGFDGDFANVDVTSAAVPNDRPAALPYWSDLTFQVAGAGAVYYQTIGTTPTRRFVVQWHNAYPQGSPNPVTFQAILFEGSNRLLFQYKNVSLGAGDAAHQGAHATVAIRNAGSPANNQHLEWSFNAPVLADGNALSFTATPSDTSGPVVTASAPATLWPPTGKTTQVRVQGTMTDAGSGVDLTTARFSVTDEYGLVQPNGSIVVAANGTYSVNVPLVASRKDTDKDGRTYTIVIRVKDNTGNEGSTTVIVRVPLHL